MRDVRHAAENLQLIIVTAGGDIFRRPGRAGLCPVIQAGRAAVETITDVDRAADDLDIRVPRVRGCHAGGDSFRRERATRGAAAIISVETSVDLAARAGAGERRSPRIR